MMQTMLKVQLNIFWIFILFAVFMSLEINLFAQAIDPLSLHFKKDYQVRNFYSSSVLLSKIDFDHDVLDDSLYPKMHLTSPGCSFEQHGQALQISNTSKTKQQSFVSLGKLYNYAAIDLDILSQHHKTGSAIAQLSFYIDDGNYIVLSQRDIDAENKEISLEIQRDNQSVFSQTLSAKGVAAPNTLRVHLTGKFLNVLLVKDEKWTVLGSFDISEHFELRDKKVLESFKLLAGAKLASGESVSISKVEQYLTTGTAQADPKILHYEDGAPIIDGNKIWVAMTTRGYGTQLYQGIYSYDLECKKWQISGTLVFNKGDGLIRQWAASDVFYNRKSKTWKVFTVSHRDDHMLYSGETKNDLRSGLTEIDCSKVKYESVGNEEDPSVIWDSEANKWRMAVCKAKKGYQTILMEADTWNGHWKQIDVYKPTSSTGVLIQKIGGKRYVFIGRGDTPCPMEVLSYPEMEKIGELNLSEHPVGKNVWPAILPVTKEKGTAYYLLTFDRDAWTGPRTYGNIHWYKAEEFAKGFWEYRYTNGPVKKQDISSFTYDKNVPQPTLSEVQYGDHERHIIDFWKAKSDQPTPLVFVIHGGGWMGGSKERIHRFADVRRLLEAGISVAAINYRYVSQAPDSKIDPPVKTPLYDAARALQFVRCNADEWNIDKNRIGAAGGSAGACSSLWLLYHDDLVNPKSDDPISQESTRLQCAAVIGAQTSLDPKQMKEWTPNSRYGGHAFGIKNFKEFSAERDNILSWIREYSPYELVSSDDPPVCLLYANPPALGQEQKDPTHTSNFGVKLQEKCKTVGVKCEFLYDVGVKGRTGVATEYLIKMLTKEE